MLPGRRLRGARRWRIFARHGLDEALRRARRRRPAGARDLPRPPARARARPTRTAASPGSASFRAAPSGSRGPRPADRLGGRRRGARTTSRTPTPPRRRPRPRGRRASSPRRGSARSLGVQFHPEKSGAARRRASSRAIPLPRLIPCLDVAGGRVVKGIRFQGLRDVGDPVELGAAYSDRGADELVFLDVKATLEEPTRSSSSSRGSPSSSRSRSPSAAASAPSRTRTRCSARARTRSRSTRRRSTRPALMTELAATARLAGRRRRDRRRGRTRPLARRHHGDAAPRDGVGARGAGARCRGDPADLDRRRRNPSGYDLDSRPRSRTRSRSP